MSEVLDGASSLAASSVDSAFASDSDLRDNVPGQSVMQEFLRRQAEARPRGAVARFFGVDPRHPDAVAWYQGVQGEQRVAAALRTLGPEWTVLHAVPVGRGESDIDHVVIGPAGVFTINSKRHHGQKIWLSERQLRVGGQVVKHLRNARFEAERAAKLLSARVGFVVPVHAMVIIVDAGSWTIRSRPSDVHVDSPRDGVRWMRRRRAAMTPDALAQVRDAAASPATWSSRAPASLVGAAPFDVSLFHAAAAEVEQARGRRRFWLVLAGLGVLAAVGLLIASAGGEIFRLFTFGG